VTVTSYTWRQHDPVYVVRPKARERQLRMAWRTGVTPRRTWNLQPQQTVIIPATPIPLRPALEFNLPGLTALGEYVLRHELADLRLKSGLTPIRVRARKPTDDPAAEN